MKIGVTIARKKPDGKWSTVADANTPVSEQRKAFSELGEKGYCEAKIITTQGTEKRRKFRAKPKVKKDPKPSAEEMKAPQETPVE